MAPYSPAELARAEERLRKWRRQHDTPEKVAAAHRKVLLERVVESMAFENEPVGMARLESLLESRKGKWNGTS